MESDGINLRQRERQKDGTYPFHRPAKNTSLLVACIHLLCKECAAEEQTWIRAIGGLAVFCPSEARLT